MKNGVLKTAKELKTRGEMYEALENSFNENNIEMAPPLFHGTDASLVGCDKEERDLINISCVTIINALVELFMNNGIDPFDPAYFKQSYYKQLAELRDSFMDFTEAYQAAIKRNNSSLWDYGDFFVTNNPTRAIAFSKEAWIFGETGTITKLLIEGAKVLGLELPGTESMNKAFELFQLRHDGKKDPCIIMIPNVNYKNLKEYGSCEPLDIESEYMDILGDQKKKKELCSAYVNLRLDLDRIKDDSQIYMIRNYSEFRDGCIAFTKAYNAEYENCIRLEFSEVM